MVNSQDYINWVAQNFSSQGVQLKQSIVAGKTVSVAYQKKFKKLFLSQLKILTIISIFDNLKYEDAVALTESAGNYSKTNAPGLPRGFQSGVFCFPVMAANTVDPAAIQYVAQRPKKQWAAVTMPVVYDLSSGSIYYFTSTPIWGFALYKDFRKYIEKNYHFKPTA